MKSSALPAINSKHILVVLLVLFFWFIPRYHRIHAAPAISDVSDNRASYTNGEIPLHKKFEVTFSVITVARSTFAPYEPANFPNGLGDAERHGITVNAEVLPPGESSWTRAVIQPAFYFQDFVFQNQTSRDSIYPTGRHAWKVRFAPTRTGTWRYRLTATDETGTSTSGEYTMNAVTSDSHGFVRVADGDRRYFEFTDGTYFPGLGYNMNYNAVSWENPVAANRTNFQAMAVNGIQLIRIWLSQWSVYGSSWNPWKSMQNHSGDPPLEMLSSNVAPYNDGKHEISLIVSKNTNTNNSCIFNGSGGPPLPLETNSRYRVRIDYYVQSLSAGTTFQVRWGGWPNGNNCALNTLIPGSTVATVGTSWQTLTAEFPTGTSGLNTSYLFLTLENPSNPSYTGRVRINEIHLYKLDASGAEGPDLIQKPVMDHHRNIDQRNAYAFDRMLELAEANNIYLKTVSFDHREWIMNHTNHSGTPTSDFACTPAGPTCPSASYLYGPTDGTITKNRFLMRAWWRYMKARWGYSPNIHSWEFVNEGANAYEHEVAANMMGTYFDSLGVNKQMVAPSSWNQNRSTAVDLHIGSNPGMDYADIHRYITKENQPALYFDEAEMSISLSNEQGASNPAVHGNWPVIRGEAGFQRMERQPDGTMTLAPTSEIPCNYQRGSGIFLHNYLFAGLNGNALMESYWYETEHIYPNRRFDCNEDGVTNQNDPIVTFDLRPYYKQVRDFLNGTSSDNAIPLNRGGYVDIGATGYDTSAFRIVGQKNPYRNLAHVWIQNRKHTWCAVAGISGCPVSWDNSPLSGTITIPGLSGSATLPVEYWNFDTAGRLTVRTATVAVSQGTVTIQLSPSANVNIPAGTADVAIKIGNYSQSTTPSPTPSPAVAGDGTGDGIVDGRDFTIWLNSYIQGGTITGGPSAGDYYPTGSPDGRVDGQDFTVWLRGYTGG